MIDNQPVWDDAPWTPPPTLTGEVHADSCVIGLGGSGLTAIGELLARHLSVVGLDAIDVGAGAAGRNGGFLLAGAYDFHHDAVRRHGRARSRALYRATIAEIDRIAAAASGTVRIPGSRRLAATREEVADCREQLAAMQEDGLPVSWYEGDDGVGLTIPTDGAMNPLARCRLLATRLLANGARLFAGSPVRGIERSASAVRVVTDTAVVHCARVIVAVDGRLDVLLPELADRVRTARLQMLATAPATGIVVPCPVYRRDGFDYWQQRADGAIAVGGCRDRAGDVEWTTDAEPTPTVQAMLEQVVRSHLQVTAPITHRWAASAGYTTTGLPVIEQVRAGVWAIGGYSGTGNVIGSLAARAVVAACCDGDPARAQLLLGAEWEPCVTDGASR